MTTSSGDFRIPITIHLHVHTVRAIHAAAKRASDLLGREVTARELIERRVTDAVVGAPNPNMPAVPPLFTAEERAQMTNGKAGHAVRLTERGQEVIRSLTEAGKTAEYIAGAIGCHPSTVANYRTKLRAEPREETAHDENGSAR
jgi:DNA-binding NarL/FixJ family response regulator